LKDYALKEKTKSKRKVTRVRAKTERRRTWSHGGRV